MSDKLGIYEEEILFFSGDTQALEVSTMEKGEFNIRDGLQKAE